MSARLTKLKPIGGFCAETAGAITLLTAAHFGGLVSTTHTITGAIVGSAPSIGCGRSGGLGHQHRLGLGVHNSRLSRHRRRFLLADS
jgi:PiT family inorganic phosphate transporter